MSNWTWQGVTVGVGLWLAFGGWLLLALLWDWLARKLHD